MGRESSQLSLVQVWEIIYDWQKLNDLAFVSTQDSRKKADIYLNGHGISIKQIGGSFSFNRIQRANIANLYEQLEFTDIETKLALIDRDVYKFHQNLLTTRDVLVKLRRTYLALLYPRKPCRY